MAASKKTTKPVKQEDWYVMVTREQQIKYMTPKEMYEYLNPPLKADGSVVTRQLLKTFPRTSGGYCPFSAFDYSKDGKKIYGPVWPIGAVIVLKNGKDIFSPEPTKTTITAEIDHFEVEGYTPPKLSKKPTKK